jgi:hypothetical protein
MKLHGNARTCPKQPPASLGALSIAGSGGGASTALRVCSTAPHGRCARPDSSQLR